MKEIALTRGRVALVDDEDAVAIGAHKWSAAERKAGVWYAVRTVTVAPYRGRVIYMHRAILGVTERTVLVDHANGDGLDNRRANLRECSRSQNSMNGRGRRGTSRYKGVHWSHAHGKWGCAIKAGDRHIWLGLFSDEEEAARVYDAAAKAHFGRFARLNFATTEARP